MPLVMLFHTPASIEDGGEGGYVLGSLKRAQGDRDEESETQQVSGGDETWRLLSTHLEMTASV